MTRTRIFETARITGLFIGIVGFGLLATGCSLRSATPTASTNPQVRIWRTDQTTDVFKDIIADFNQQIPNVDVTFTRKNPRNYELEAYKSLAALTGPDIWSIPDQWLPDEQDRVLALPDTYYSSVSKTEKRKIADVVKDLYPTGITDQIIGSDGHVYALPTGVDVLQLYYNSDVTSTALDEFRKSETDATSQDLDTQVTQLLSKPPTTWNDLLNTAKYVNRRDGNTITRSAIAFGTADNVPNSADVLQLLMLQNGVKLVSTDHRNALFHIPTTTPSGGQVNPGENALQFYTSFADPSKDNYSWNPSMPQALDAFGQGKVAMVIAFSSFGDQLKIKYPKLQFDTVSVPQISASPLQQPVNLIQFSAETITKNADNPDQALNFFRLYTGENDVNSIVRATHLVTPFKAALQNSKGEFPFDQILSGVSVYKKNHDLFDAAFRQMAVDVTQNHLSTTNALVAGADAINILLAGKQDDQ